MDGVLSLPYGHQSLREIDNFKHQKGQKIEKYFLEEKDKLLELEKNLKNALRLYIYHQILTQSPKIVNLNQENNFGSLNQSFIKKSTKDIVLSGKWMK